MVVVCRTAATVDAYLNIPFIQILIVLSGICTCDSQQLVGIFVFTRTVILGGGFLLETISENRCVHAVLR